MKRNQYSWRQWFNIHAESPKYSKKVFLQSDTKKCTYEQIEQDILALSKELNDLIDLSLNCFSLSNKNVRSKKTQVKSSVRIGLLLPFEGEAGIDYVTLILATFLLKSKFPYLLIIPLNHHKPEVVLEQEINQAGISLVINGFIDREFSTQPKLSESDEHDYQAIDFHTLKKHSYAIKTMVLKKWREELIRYQMNRGVNTVLTTPAVALFTSGSSGAPKLAVFTWKQFLTAAVSANRFFSFGDRSHAWLVLLPLYHVSGFSLIVRALQGGGRLVFINSNKTKTWWQAVKEHRISHVSLVTAQLPPMDTLAVVRKYLGSLEFALVGGGPIEPQVLEVMNQKIGKVSPPLFRATYGLTESLAQVATYDGVQEYPYRILPGRKVKVFRGQIYLHRDTLFSGYVRFPVSPGQNYRLRYPWTKAGWFPTGDMGKKQGERIMVLGRKDRQFISGGENIYPEEVERVIQSFMVQGNPAGKNSTSLPPPVLWTCVISETHKKWGQVPVAILKLNSCSSTNIRLTAKALHIFLCSRLERYKVPRKYFSFNGAFKEQLGGIKPFPSRVQQEYQNNPKAFKQIFRHY